MKRITVDVPDEDLIKIDAEVEKHDLSRSKWAAEAIDAFLKHTIREVDESRLQRDLDAKTQECNKLSRFKEECEEQAQELEKQRAEIEKLREEIDEIRAKEIEARNESLKYWEDLKNTKKEKEKLNKEIEAAQSMTSQLQSDLRNKQVEIDQITTLKIDLAVSQKDRDNLRDALKSRDDALTFFQGHVSQLTQTIGQKSLPPGKEEAIKKKWWQFWRTP